jgi:hypothetical protein
VDKSTVGANTSFLNVDTSRGQVCLAGQVFAVDQIANRSVTYTYNTVGTISKATDKTVRADSNSVSLTLDITELTNPIPEYSETITAECKVKASLQKEGTKDKVSLRCDVGENLSDFTGLTPELIENVANARLKRVKVNTKKGKLKIATVGVPANAGVPVSCDFPPPTTTTTTTVPTTTSTTTTTVPGTTTTSTTVPGTTTTSTTVPGTTTTSTTVAGTTTTSTTVPGTTTTTSTTAPPTTTTTTTTPTTTTTTSTTTPL